MSSEPSSGCCGLASMSIDLATPLAVHADGLDRQVGQRLEHGVGQPVVFVVVVAASWLRRCGGSLPPSVMRHHHRDQRDAVADAVVDAHDQRAAAFVVLDQVELPQRVRRVQRRRGQLAARAPAARARSLWPRLRRAASRAPHGASMSKSSSSTQLAPSASSTTFWRKRAYLQQLVARCARTAPRSVMRRLQQPDADDHHQVDVVVHAQPGGVHARHALGGVRHRASPRRCGVGRAHDAG